MTFGNQNSEKEGFDQMDLATDMGVNFIDTAELVSCSCHCRVICRY